MPTNGWSKQLITIITSIVMAFGGLCIYGYFDLRHVLEANAAMINSKIETVDTKRQETRIRVERLEECMLSVKDDIGEIKDNVKMILRRVK